MTALVLLNPYANRWQARKQWAHYAAALRAAGVAFRVVETQSAADLRQQAQRAAEGGFSPILIAGGDGTIGIALNGLVNAWGTDPAAWQPVGIIPLGTANDLVANLGLPVDPVAVAACVAGGVLRPLDVCRVNERFFINNAALGIEASIAWRQNRMTWAAGLWRYFAAAIAELMRRPAWQARLEWDDGHWEGEMIMLSVGNGRRTGGIYYTVPDADPWDGRLSFVWVRATHRRRLIALMQQLMDRERSYLDAPEVQQRHTTRLHVQLTPPSPAHADGEIFATAGHEFTYRVYPGLLPLLVPEAGRITP